MKKNFKHIFYVITLLSIIIMCNFSVVQADSNPPTECRISINNDALYTNNRKVTLELFANDADAMQVWISNDGVNGTVIDFTHNKTYTITDTNYTVGVALTSSNSTTSTNSNNVLRIENWPLSSVNGTKKVYAVFRDAYGNKTSTTGLTTINVSYNLNGVSGNTPSTITTVKNLGVYMPNVVSGALNKSFLGWSKSSTATLTSYSANTLGAFDADTTLYAVYKTVSAGDYVTYYVDTSTATYSVGNTVTGTSTQTFSIANKAGTVYQVLSATASSIIICPAKSSQLFSLKLCGKTAYNNGTTAINNICGLYKTTYSSSVACISTTQINTATSINGLSSIVSNPLWITTDWGYYAPDSNTYGGTHGAATYCSGGLEIHPMTANWDSDKYQSTVYSYPVLPVITLKSTVRFTGQGTSASPYTLSI